MRGTEKQIAWAEEIQKIVIDTLTEMHDFFINDQQYDGNNPVHIQRALSFLNNIEAIKNEEYAGEIIEMFSRVADKKDKSAMERWKCFISCLAVTGNSHKNKYER